MIPIEECIKTFLAAFGSNLTDLTGNYSILSLCCAFILIDLTTGLAKAKIQGKINSDTGYQGFWRKTAMLTALVFGICLDALIDYVGTLGIISISLDSPVGRLLALYIAINECISILENLVACGVKMPKFISAALEAVQEDLDQK